MPISLSNRPIVAVTMGDPSGIGPEIILKTLAKPSMKRLASFLIVGDFKVLRDASAALESNHRIVFKGLRVIKPYGFKINKRLLSSANRVSVLDLENVPLECFSFGKESALYGKASVEYIKIAYDLARDHIADCIVTAPINKLSLKMSGFKFPGHTEYLASLSKTRRYVMMLVGGPLRVSLVTRHIPLSEVPRQLTTEKIAETIEITLDSLKRDFNILKPKIGVCGLNPHCGEKGIFGNEEAKIIEPAVRKFKKNNVIGPIPSDALFYEAYRGRFDGVICHYHDQGLIPLKMIARDTGVNVTLGLGLIRTSPDHGTAFDIAGKNKADPSSMEEAIRLAVSMAINRKTHAHKE